MILLIQPPFVQLNAPYPSLYYLRSFLEARGYTVQVDDHSISLFHRIFSPSGLRRIFADAEARLSKGPALAPELEAIARRYLSEQDLWLAHIERLVAFLQGKDREYAHILALCNNTLPTGPRAEALLTAHDFAILPDQAPILASTMLADLADLITVVLDPTFSLVKYADSLAASIRSFSLAASALDGYILNTFYEPLLKDTWDQHPEKPELIGLTIPFPGCLAGALCAARSAKAYYGQQVLIIAGGGYVTTELRHIKARDFFDYIDFLAYDRGYGALQSVLDYLRSQASPGNSEAPELHHCIYRSFSGAIRGSAEGSLEAYANLDRDATGSVFPDYRGVPFDRYIIPVDDTNPMHRLWTEGHWLKAYLAHGCYWHACAFCDVQLDYIRSFQSIPVEALFKHLLWQSRETRIRGVHLVDEAAPVSSLIELALLNRAAGLTLTFWGNIRFEKAFTPDVAALLAAGGLLGVSGGIEVASEAGFKRLGKGIGLKDVVYACAAFKEAGILTHAYLIYGYWDQDDQEIIDAAETLRQLFAAGLIDSAFWHKFVLTRHSRIYRELAQGRHRDLQVIDEPALEPEDFFADNDLRFAGENRYDRYTEPLDRLLAEWMAGDTDRPVQEAFPFTMPDPTITRNRVQLLLDSYVSDKEKTMVPPGGTQNQAESQGKTLQQSTRAIFLGTRPWIQHRGAQWNLTWRWNFIDWTIKISRPERGQGGKVHPKKSSVHQSDQRKSENEFFIITGNGSTPERIAQQIEMLIQRLHSGRGEEPEKIYGQLSEILTPEDAPTAWHFLRSAGLVTIPNRS